MKEISQETILQIEDDKRIIFCKGRGCRKRSCCSCIAMLWLICDILSILSYVIEVIIAYYLTNDQIENLPEKYKFAVFYVK